jgi:hypothetical protein
MCYVWPSFRKITSDVVAQLYALPITNIWPPLLGKSMWVNQGCYHYVWYTLRSLYKYHFNGPLRIESKSS